MSSGHTSTPATRTRDAICDAMHRRGEPGYTALRGWCSARWLLRTLASRDVVMTADTLRRHMRVLATVYARCDDAKARAAVRALVALMLSREGDLRRALALCDHAHVSLQHAEKHDDYGACPGDSEATDGRSLAVVIGRCLDVLATPLRQPEHAAARADLAALFITWDERIIEPWIACRLRVHHKAALAAEYATWKAARA